ncbi:MAG: nicotinate-nucleotide adenylyltransferase [Phenylobacterium sp.]
MWSAGPAARRAAPLARGGFLLQPGMRVGLFGGSFNPAHAGHAHVAVTALRRLRLDRVIWLVSPQNPLKSSAETAPLAARVGSARTQARGPSMIVTDVETAFGSQFTIDTLRALKARWPAVRFVWIMGADGLASFHRWRGWTQIMREVPVAVVSRPRVSLRARFSPAALRFARFRRSSSQARTLPLAEPPAWMFLRAPLNFQSSTALRERGRNLEP